MFGLSLATMKITSEKDGHGFVEEAGAGVIEEDSLPLSCGVAGLFEELATSGSKRRFAFIDATGGNFPKVAPGGKAVLANEKNAGLGAGLVERKDDDGAGMANDVAAGADAAGLDDLRGLEVEDTRAEDNARRENARTGGGRGFLGGHEINIEEKGGEGTRKLYMD